MSLRWRADGILICAAMSLPENGDTYIDDRLHYQLAEVERTIYADVDHEENGLWHWSRTNNLRAKPVYLKR